MDDVITNVIGFGQSKDDQIMPATTGGRARAGGFGFFMPGLAMNDAGHGIVRVLADALPDAHHVAASRINELAAPGLELFHDGDFGAEGGNDDHVVFFE